MSIVFLALVLGGECRTVVRQPVFQQVAYETNLAAITYQPVAIAYPTFLYAAGDTARLQKLEEIATQNAQLLQQNAAIVEALRTGGVAGPGPLGPVASPAQTDAQKLITASCLKCHSGPTPKGKLDLTDLGKLSVGQKLLMVDKIESNEMPPAPAPQVADADFQNLRRWALEDRKAVREFLKAPGK